MSAATKKRTLQIVATRTLKMSHDVLCVRYSNSTDPSKLLVAASLLDNTVKIFYEDSLRFFLSLYGHKLPVLSLAISSDDKLLVTGSADKNLKVWGLDFEGGERAVDVQVKNLRSALGEAGGQIRTVFKAGYKLEEEAQ